MADIFDKIAGGLSKGVASINTNSKAMVEKTKIKAEIHNLDKERKNLAELLGMQVYERYTMSGEVVDDEAMSNFIMEIYTRLDKISSHQAEIKRIDEETKAVNAEMSAKFCKCGKPAIEGAKFCGYCGHNF